jgi:hydrogenase maturation protease
MRSSSDEIPTLVLGIGNILMGDEGVGVECAVRLRKERLPGGVECVDGGTGGFALLEWMHRARKIILIDAAADGDAPGTIRRLTPRFSSDYPRSLTAHDIGLKDLLDAFHLLGDPPDVVLFTVSVVPPGEPRLGLSAAVEAAVPEVVRRARDEITAFRAPLP